MRTCVGIVGHTRVYRAICIYSRRERAGVREACDWKGFGIDAEGCDSGERGHRRNWVGINVLWADDLNRHVASW